MSDASSKRMSKAAIDAFLAEPVLARIATVDGERPHVVPMWFDWDGDSIWMETGLGFRKHKNLLANPHCAVAIDVTAGGLRFKGVILEGKAELLTEPPGFIRQVVVRIYTKYLGPEGINEPIPREMIDAEHVLIKLTPTRIISWDGLAPVP